jgi:hypothetical protein
MSRAQLTGYDNEVRSDPTCKGLEHGGTSCLEVFEYAAGSGELTCASCNPTGQRPIGQSNLSLLRPPPAYSLGPQRGNLSPEGNGRLFFESQDELSPQDTNGGIQDVYEFEPNGVGSCNRAKGCVSLISSGHGRDDSWFVYGTPSGDDAFFATRENLSLLDTGDQFDLYDARVGGGFEETTAVPCGGETCRGTLAPTPASQPPASSSFAGSGNERPRHHRKKHRRKKRNHKRQAEVRAAKHYRGGSK